MADVNDKKNIIKLPSPTYYHCFKLNDSNYALFDAKMNMSIIIGSITIIKSTKLPLNSFVFSYKINQIGFFEKTAQKYIEMNKDSNGKHLKPPLKEVYNTDGFSYHHFKLSSVLSVLFCENFKMPVRYGSNDKIQVVINAINKINKSATIFYYKEDINLKNSFKFYKVFPK